MKPILIAGSSIVTLALISYSIAIITEQRKSLISNRVLFFMTLGVVLDITATTCMIIARKTVLFASCPNVFLIIQIQGSDKQWQ